MNRYGVVSLACGLMVLVLTVGSANADLVAHWKFDGDATDSVGVNDGAIYGAQFTDGVLGDALVFDGQDDYVSGSTSPFDFANTTFTVSAWFKKSDTEHGIIVSEGGRGSGWFLSSAPTGQIFVNLKKSNSYDAYVARTTETYAGDQWHHVAAVITTDTSGSSGNNADIYVDGNLVGVTHERIGAYGVSTTGWTIGTREAGYDTFFKGIIDDVRVYDEALSAEAIGALADVGADVFPVAHWKFDGDADDSVGTNHGVIHGAQSTDGVLGGALLFDGQDDYVSGSTSPFDFANTTFTASAWFKKSDSEYGMIVSEGGRNSGWFLAVYPTGQIKVLLKKSNSYDAYTAITTGAYADGLWHHVAAVITTDTSGSSGNNADIYVDGNLVGVTHERIGAYGVSTTGWTIGTREAGYDYFFNGIIDDVRVYDKALSADEIADIYSALEVSVDIKPGSCPNPLNVKSFGVLPVAILGTEDFDVSLIDPASIQLNGVGAIRSSLEDVATPMLGVSDCDCIEEGPDGFIDLTLKFKTQEIVEALGEVEHGDVITLKLTGVGFGEIPIEGADCIIIRGSRKPFNKGDINKDGVVNSADFAIFAQNWLQSSIVDD